MAEKCIVTAPSIIRRASTECGFHGVVVDVGKGRQILLLVEHRNAVIPVLEQVPRAGILGVVPADEPGSQALKERRQMLLRGMHHQMNVIVHKTIGINIDIKCSFAFGQGVQHFEIIGILLEDDMLINRTKNDMIYASRTENSRLS